MCLQIFDTSKSKCGSQWLEVFILDITYFFFQATLSCKGSNIPQGSQNSYLKQIQPRGVSPLKYAVSIS